MFKCKTGNKLLDTSRSAEFSEALCYANSPSIFKILDKILTLEIRRNIKQM